MKEVGIFIFLAGNAWRDWKRKEIFLPSVAFMLLWGLWEMRGLEAWWPQFLNGVGVGMVLCALSLATKGAIGMGDALLAGVLGIMMSPEAFWGTVSLGMLLAGMVSLLLITVKKKAGNTEIPFVPFLLAAYMGGMYLWGKS